jgi:hypothetical protein
MKPAPLRLRWHILLLFVAAGTGWLSWMWLAEQLGPQ